MEGAERRTWAQSGLNARDWASQNACLIDVGYFIHDRLRPHRQVPADLGVKESGLWRSDVCCQIAAKNDQVPFAVTPKGTLTRTFVVAGGGFEPPTSGF